MLSTHEFDDVVRILPPLRRAPRQSCGPRAVGVRLVPRSVAAQGSHAEPSRASILVEQTAALLYGLPFYGVSCLAMVRAVVRRRRQRRARHHMEYAAAGMGAGHGGQQLSS